LKKEIYQYNINYVGIPLVGILINYNKPMKILIIEDNPNLNKNLCFLLKKHNFLAEWVFDWKQALEKINNWSFDAIVLDINMPVLNGKEFLKILREKWNNTPVIALTSDWMLSDKLEVFELGADDYMTKPFEIEELVMRIKSILKRAKKISEDKIIVWDFEINFSKSKISPHPASPKREEFINFPHKQYLIIEYLAKNKWFPIQKIKLMEYVWWEAEENLDFNSTTLESHIYAIRKKLGKSFIKTIKWVWYIIE